MRASWYGRLRRSARDAEPRQQPRTARRVRPRRRSTAAARPRRGGSAGRPLRARAGNQRAWTRLFSGCGVTSALGNVRRAGSPPRAGCSSYRVRGRRGEEGVSVGEHARHARVELLARRTSCVRPLTGIQSSPHSKGRTTRSVCDGGEAMFPGVEKRSQHFERGSEASATHALAGPGAWAVGDRRAGRSGPVVAHVSRMIEQPATRPPACRISSIPRRPTSIRRRRPTSRRPPPRLPDRCPGASTPRPPDQVGSSERRLEQLRRLGRGARRAAGRWAARRASCRTAA